MTELTAAIEVAERRFGTEDSNVMVSVSKSEPSRRHVSLRKDDGGLYVRLGRGGGAKRYLKEMSGSRVVDRAMNLVVFYE